MIQEQIKAEIEWLINNWKLCESSEAKYRLEAYNELLYYINSLPEEPVSEDLEEAAKNWWEGTRFKSDLSGTPINAFKEGSKWNGKHLINKACEWLVDNIYGYVEESQKYSDGYSIDLSSLVIDFRKAMEEEK